MIAGTLAAALVALLAAGAYEWAQRRAHDREQLDRIRRYIHLARMCEAEGDHDGIPWSIERAERELDQCYAPRRVAKWVFRGL